MRYPIPAAEFAALAPDTLVTAREVFSTTRRRGFLPFGRSKFYEHVHAGTFPPGRLVGMNRYWRVAEIRAGAAGLMGAAA